MAAKSSMKSVDPLSVGVDPGMLKDYDKAMKRAIRQGILPGCASVALRKGQVVHTGNYGLADPDTGLRFDEETICRVYCFTKAYTILVFMMLVEEGRAKLHDPLDKYIPSFKHVMVASAGELVKPRRPLRLKHLLKHVSGLGYSASFGEEAQGDTEQSYAPLISAVKSGRIRSLRGFVDRLAKLPLRFHPGAKYEYGFSIDVLARVIEVIEGKNIDCCLQERLFLPLGMHDTGFSVPDHKLSRLAACYGSASTWGSLYGSEELTPQTAADGLVRIDGTSAKLSAWRSGQHCSVHSGGGWMPDNQGGLVSTVSDTLRFVRMLLRHGVSDGGGRLLQKATLDFTFKHYITGDGGLSGKEVGHGGAACTYWTLDPKTDYAIVWFAQHVDMPEWEDQKAVDAKKADLWNVMFEATRADRAKGKKRKRSEAAKDGL